MGQGKVFIGFLWIINFILLVVLVFQSISDSYQPLLTFENISLFISLIIQTIFIFALRDLDTLDKRTLHNKEYCDRINFKINKLEKRIKDLED